MEPTPAKHPDERPTPPPVMDVVPPKPVEAPRPLPQKEDDLPSPPLSGDAEQPSHKDHHNKTPKPNVTKPPKQHGSGVGLAIFATIVIVLGLAALFVYAYLRTNHLTIF